VGVDKAYLVKVSEDEWEDANTLTTMDVDAVLKAMPVGSVVCFIAQSVADMPTADYEDMRDRA